MHDMLEFVSFTSCKIIFMFIVYLLFVLIDNVISYNYIRVYITKSPLFDSKNAFVRQDLKKNVRYHKHQAEIINLNLFCELYNNLLCIHIINSVFFTILIMSI